MIDWVVPKIRFSGILGISWKMVFALAYTPFWKLNKYAINLAKKIMITLVQLAFYTHSFKTLAKKPKPNVLDTWSVTKLGSLIISENRCARAPFALGSLPHWQLLYPPTVNFVTLPNEEDAGWCWNRCSEVMWCWKSSSNFCRQHLKT